MTHQAIPKSAQQDCAEFVIKVANISTELKAEIRGWWIWIGGNTKPYASMLKELGCRWAAKKKLWYWKHPNAPKRRYKKTEWNMGRIRDTFNNDETLPLQEGLDEMKDSEPNSREFLRDLLTKRDL